MSSTIRRRAVLTLLVLLVVATPASATWSIVVVDTATGEVAIGCATCLVGLDLEDFVPVVIPGVGAAAAQASVGGVTLRMRIRDELIAGKTPAQILAILGSIDFFHQDRQYGIVDVHGNAATFTGSNALAYAGGLTGQAGTLVYSIQGNVVAGAPVLGNAEAALVGTPGGLIEKLMAAMDAARLAGGDGRCSCSNSNPAGCGAPPPSFTKSSHIAFMIAARPGDTDVPCSASGCAEGSYYMNLNVANQAAGAPDPVTTLQGMLATFRAQQLGRPDHFLSTATFDVAELPSDGVSVAMARVELRDWQGTRLPVGGAVVTLTPAPGSVGSVGAIGPVVDNNDGTYDVPVTAGTLPGSIEFEVSVDDGLGAVRVTPGLALSLTSPFGPCGDGTTNDDVGPPAETLRINGSPGSENALTVATLAPLTFSVDVPPGLPANGPAPYFIVWARPGIPTPSDALPLGDVGTLCFAPPGVPGAFPGTVTVANAWALPTGILPAHPAPWAFTTSGIPIEAEFSLQGIVIHDAPFEPAVTNAILLRTRNFPPPTIASVAPTSAAAGDVVTVTGTEFQSLAMIDVGGVPAVLATVTEDLITFTMPAGAGCDVLLTLTNPDGQSVSAPMNPTPVITSTTMGSGPIAGGVSFFIIGTDMLGTSVTIDGVPAMVLANTEIVVVVRTPPGAAGVAPVVVSSPAGCTATTTYTYF